MMDKIDKKLLDILSRNARIHLKELAAEVFLSAPAVASRLERLEAGGIITGYKANIDYSKLGFNITAFINLSMSPKNKAAFINYISKASNVIECYNVTGSFSMLLKAYFANTSELDEFVMKLQKYGRTQTQIVFSTIKQTEGIVYD